MHRNDDPQTATELAQRLANAGRLAEAEAAYAQILARWPHLTDTWYNLARLQRHMGKFDAALASYQQALDRGISQPEEVHLNRGVIYSDALHQPALAEQELSAALRLNPGYVPALFNLANLHEDRGQRDAALAIYQRILTLQPDHHEALARLAGITSVTRADDLLIQRLRSAIDSSTDAADKASLGFALGKALDACGAYDEAFAACSAANRASRSLAGAHALLYDRHRQERCVDELMAAFRGQVLEGASPWGARPIFVCGMFRSGSTLTEQILAAHPQVAAGGELPLLPNLIAQGLTPFPASMSRVGADRLRQLATLYRQGLQRLFPEATTVTDKRPDNFLNVGLIKLLFPDARIVHTTRNALDNCLSIYFLHLDHRMGYALDLLDTGHYYAQYRRLMAHWQALYGADILDFDYDTYVRDPRTATARLLQFCDLSWEEGCMNFHKAATSVRTASVWQVRQPVYRHSSGRWQHYAQQLEPLRRYLLECHLLN